ncbi:hypothetical protein ElyMa_003192300 [Elysia marginata]|uniref:G-protein coupled receptors family 1 profile domain-containing protein n=1 Tax=Elysia marginata TaxID=1093978 RepID=A0AAV4J1X0_9GAST|nr:hypothetical protein ElyMa_003192300 [Elysia marginata]
MENASNITNSSKRHVSKYFEDYRMVVTWTLAIETVFMVVGTGLNLWFLLSILTSKDLRVRMRNQLIVNLNAVHLLQTTVKCPVLILKNAAVLHRVLLTREFFCHTYSIITSADQTQSFIADWLMVFIVGIFIANIMDVDVASKWTPQVSRFSKAAMHLLPWVVAIVVTPIGISQATRWYPCLVIPWRKLYIFETVYTIIPTAITLLLMVIAIVLRYRRFSHGSRTGGANMGVQLIGKGAEIDNTFAYVFAAFLCVACEVCHLIFSFEIIEWKYRGLKYHMASYLVSDSRVILMLLPWLLLPDIRQRLRSWRPWQREAAGIDLTIAYGKESS